MRVIDVAAARARRGTAAAESEPITLLNYGPTGAGKTELLATFPRPIILAEGSEQGWITVINMAEEKFYEPSVLPQIWPISTAQEMLALIEKLPGEIKAGRCKTIGVDSLSFYHDLYLNMLMDYAAKAAGPNKEPDTRKVYSGLAGHLRDIRIRLHNMGVNVVWNCQDAALDNDHPVSGPNLAGQSRAKFPAGCSLVTYSNKQRVGRDEVFQLHTKQYGPYPARGRYGELLPPVIQNPTYRKLCWYLFENGRAREAQGEFFGGVADTALDEAPVAAPAPAAGTAPSPAPTPTVRPSVSVPARPVSKPAAVRR